MDWKRDFKHILKQENSVEPPKQFSRRKVFLLAAILLIFGMSTYFFLKHNPKNIKEAITAGVTTPPPPPTEIDSNFIYQINTCFLPITSAYGYNLRVSSGFRSLEEQAQLYAQGREVEGHIVTHTLKSIHNFGFAVDVVDRFQGYDVDWDRIGKMGAYCGLEQGDEEYDEKVHFQNRGGLTIEQFEAGMRPQKLELPCPIMAERATSEEKLTKVDLQQCKAPKF